MPATTTPPQLFEMQVERFLLPAWDTTPAHNEYPRVIVHMDRGDRKMMLTHRKSSYTVDMIHDGNVVFSHEFVGQQAFEDFTAFLGFIN